MAWSDYLMPNFNSVIDECLLDLTTMCTRVVNDIALHIPLKSLLALRERTDKLISNVFRSRIDILLAPVSLYQCRVCSRLLTSEQAQLIPCTGHRMNFPEDELPESESFLTANGAWFTNHVLPEAEVDKISLMKFLRDEKRICWMEIYLKMLAAIEPPCLCEKCG